MSAPTFSFYLNEYEMENWRPGDTFPPAKRAESKKGADIKLENVWPREKSRANGHINGHAGEDDGFSANEFGRRGDNLSGRFPVGGSH